MIVVTEETVLFPEVRACVWVRAVAARCVCVLLAMVGISINTVTGLRCDQGGGQPTDHGAIAVPSGDDGTDPLALVVEDVRMDKDTNIVEHVGLLPDGVSLDDALEVWLGLGMAWLSLGWDGLGWLGLGWDGMG